MFVSEEGSEQAREEWDLGSNCEGEHLYSICTASAQQPSSAGWVVWDVWRLGLRPQAYIEIGHRDRGAAMQQ